MSDIQKFQEMLTEILNVARVQENKLSIEEIKQLFGDIDLNEEQYNHVFDYLASNNIKIEGYIKTNSIYTKIAEEEKLSDREEENSTTNNRIRSKEKSSQYVSEEDNLYLKMYLKDLKLMNECLPSEEEELVNKILSGDCNAKKRFIEANLHYVVGIAEEYRNQGSSLEDLIQEGNIGLISFLEDISNLTPMELIKERMREHIKGFIEANIKENRESSSFEKEVIEKIKFINHVVNELKEDLGKDPDISTLSQYTKITIEEIQDIINMSGDAIKVDRHHH